MLVAQATSAAWSQSNEGFSFCKINKR